MSGSKTSKKRAVTKDKKSGFEEAPARWILPSAGATTLPVNHDPDFELRAAIFEHVRKLNEVYGPIGAEQLEPGFVFKGVRIPLVNPQRGIFKPRQMKYLLSIRTVFPRPGGRIWYDDQKVVHQQIYRGDDAVEYAFMGRNADAADNRWLREAGESRIPFIYFLGVAPGLYQPVIPTFVIDWNGADLKATIAFGDIGNTHSPPETSLERRYALRTVRQRLHQASFRVAVIQAYGGRCAFSNLPEPLLLDAAHIIPDKDERLGQAVVSNGLPLSKLHHAAFDAHLIGIDPDYRVHVSDRLLSQRDGPMLEALKQLQGTSIRLPDRSADYPNRDRLSRRFEIFRSLS